ASAADSPPSRGPARSTGWTDSARATRTGGGRSARGGPARSGAACPQPRAAAFFFARSSPLLGPPIRSNRLAWRAFVDAGSTFAAFAAAAFATGRMWYLTDWLGDGGCAG